MIKKMYEKGLGYCLKVALMLGAEQINRICFQLFCVFPMNRKRILFESEGDFSDNAQALYQYMKEQGFFDKYEAVWVADEPDKLMDKENIKAVSKCRGMLRIKTSYYLATCHYYIYDHCNLLEHVKKRGGQQIIYLSHGFGYKASKGYDTSKIVSGFDVMIATGTIPAEGNSRFWNSDINKTKILGYPRLDYFFSDLSEVRNKVREIYHWSEYKRVMLWMPTFRQSMNKDLSENYLTNETGLPIFSQEKELTDFDRFLQKEQVLFILKLHHLQAQLPVFKKKFSNIMILNDQDLMKQDIRLYQFIALTDALVTDYSSISVDYMLLDRPVIYTLDDYEKYNASRGIWPENAIDYMKGHHIYCIKDLEDSILELVKGLDRYKEDRNNVIHYFHKYIDGESSKRIVEYLGLTR